MLHSLSHARLWLCPSPTVATPQTFSIGQLDSDFTVHLYSIERLSIYFFGLEVIALESWLKYFHIQIWNMKQDSFFKNENSVILEL